MTSLVGYLYNPDGQTTGRALLCFDGRSADAQMAIRADIAAVAPWRSVRPRLVLAGPAFSAGEAPVLSDLDGKAHGAYRLEGQPALVLVRPDGHIAFRSSAADVKHLTAYCTRVFGKAAESRDVTEFGSLGSYTTDASLSEVSQA